MKKIVLLAVMLCVIVIGAFAQSYTVQEVKGRVECDVGGRRINVAAGDLLSANTVIYTGAGASLILKEGDRTFIVSSAKSGPVSALAAASTGVRIGGTVAQTDTSAVSRTTAQTSTASARASDAAEDVDISKE